MKMTDKQKQTALEAGKQAARKAAEKSKEITGLTWWERLIWVVLAGLAGAACSVLAGCSQWYAWDELSSDQQQGLQAADRAFHQWSGESVPGVAAVTEGEK